MGCLLQGGSGIWQECRAFETVMWREGEETDWGNTALSIGLARPAEGGTREFTVTSFSV